MLGGNERAGGQALVVAALEEGQEAVADLVGGHAAESRLRAVRVTSTRVVYENRWMRVHEDRTELPDGTPGLYGWVEKPPSAMIVPLDDDGVWLVEQFRHPVGERFWEFPQGAWEDARGVRRGAGARRAGRGDRPAGRRGWSGSAGCTSPTGSPTSPSTCGARPDSNRGRAGARAHRAGPDRAPLRASPRSSG